MVEIIMLTYYSFLEVQGGAPLYTYHIAKHLVKKGFDVTVLCRSITNQNSLTEYEGIKIKQYDKSRFDYTKYHRIIDRNIFYISTIKKDFDKEGKTSDVIHLISSNFFFPLGYTQKGKKIITSVIENVINKEKGLINNLFSYYQKFQLKMALKYSNIVTVPAEIYLDYIKKYYPSYSEKVRLIPGFIETDIFSPSVNVAPIKDVYEDDRIIFLGVSSLTYSKGIDTAIKALKKVVKEYKHVRMLIAGSGPLKDELQELVNNLYVKNYVEFVGELDHYKDMRRYYALADIVIAPSRVEAGQPSFSAAEPMAMEKPVIISEANDIKGVLGDSVIRFKTDDIDDLASKVIYLLQNQDVREKIGKKARKKILERYSLEKFREAYDEIYNSLINKINKN